jgi:hypothetical protein
MTGPIIVPDAGPLITLAYAGQLELLRRPAWPVHIVDMVLQEVTRKPTPSGEAIAAFVKAGNLAVIQTETMRVYRERLTSAASTKVAPPRKTGLGELAIQEYMTRLGLLEPVVPAVFLFEDHKIARASFHLPDNVRRISTRAFLIFLEENGWIESAADVERSAVLNGRSFSSKRFP